MKIFLPFQTKSGFLGVTTFALKFKAGMEARGHEVFFEYHDDYDILFMIVQAPFKYLFEAKRKKKPIVQRLDGVFYWSVSGWRYPILNMKARIIRHFFANFTIYQSKYSKHCAEKFLGKKFLDPSLIIYNGADLNIFSPSSERKKDLRDTPNQKIFFTASAFRRYDQILPLVKMLEIYKRKYGGNFKMIFAGPFKGKVIHAPQKYQAYKELTFLGKIENKDLPEYERSADAFVFTHLNPPCPNNVIEALACGLPVCGIADGAMPELIEHGKNGLLVKTQGDAFWKTRSLDLETFADNLHTLISSRTEYGEKSRRIAEERFSLETMIENYEKAFQKLLSS